MTKALTYGECQAISDLWHGEPVDEADLAPILCKLDLRDRKELRLWASPLTNRDLDRLLHREVAPLDMSYEGQVYRFKVGLIKDAVKACGGNRAHAAVSLNLARNTVFKVLRLDARATMTRGGSGLAAAGRTTGYQQAGR